MADGLMSYVRWLGLDLRPTAAATYGTYAADAPRSDLR